MQLDGARRSASRDGRALDLTRKEFAVLQVLLEAAGAVVSPEELLDRAWDEHTDPFTNVVRVTIMKLRKSLGEPPLIEDAARRRLPYPLMRLLRDAVPKPSIRLRLTLWYGALFLLAGTVLLALNFALVARNFPSDGADLRETLEHRLELEPGELRGEFFFVVQRAQTPTRPPRAARRPSRSALQQRRLAHQKPTPCSRSSGSRASRSR